MKIGAQCLALVGALCLSPNCFPAADRADEIKNSLILLDREWSLIADWVAAYPNGHPTATAKELESAIHELDSDLYSSVIELRPRTFVVAANRVEIGTFFIVSEPFGEYRPAWNVKDFAATHDGRDDDISHWSLHSHASLFGKVDALFDSENGNSRFYVDATFQGEGFTVAKQLSVWEWNGVAATPALMGNYNYSLDSTEGVTFDGKVLRAHTKEDEFKAFFSCGGCKEPPGEWTIRITPRGVEDLGRRRLAPELDLVDNLIDAVRRRIPASSMASADVIEDLTDAIGADGYSPGMLMDWKVERQDQHMRICVETDGLGLYLFTLVQQNRKWFFTDDLDFEDLKPAQNCSDAMRLRH